MALQIGRLRPVGFAKRGAVPTVPIVPGTFTIPNRFIRYIPPFAWFPSQPPLESPGISAQREMPIKAVKGPGSLTGMKVNAELEPTDVFGDIFMGAFGQDTVTGDGVAAGHAHNFDALEAAQLPVYDWWENAGNKQFGYASCMVNKADVIWAKGEAVRVESEWTGLNFVDGLALTPTLSYPSQKPLQFAQVDVTLGGALDYDVSSVAMTLENSVVADHTLRSDTNFAMRIWTEQALATTMFEMLFASATEYNKFLNAASPSALTPTSLEMKVTSVDTWTEGLLTSAYVWHLLMPSLDYRSAEVELPTGVLKVKFAGVALPGTGILGAGGNAYSFTNKAFIAQFVNGVATPY